MVCQSDIGIVRERNEDCAYVDPDGWFVAVADGMGGQKGGDVASAVAVEAVRASLDPLRPQLAALASSGRDGHAELQAMLERTVHAANQAVVERAWREPELREMGTTLDVVLIARGDAFIAHVGDTRTYLVRGSRAKPLTIDHTVAQALRGSGKIDAAAAATSPMRSVLTNSLGGTADVEVELAHVELRHGDRLLVCSDGLYEDIGPDELAGLAGLADLEVALAKMVALARIRGGHDNITGVLIEPIVSALTAAGEWEEPTRPHVADPDRPVLRPRARSAWTGPFDEVSEETLTGFVEHAVREERSAPTRRRG
ncbi:MAG TPA: protein phosphatase 2C domain-containing protein [Kofleriaceae bacterium]|nr:protein phosphatase 2C domain-containing protein [Kofleriaceae bacterium]